MVVEEEEVVVMAAEVEVGVGVAVMEAKPVNFEDLSKRKCLEFELKISSIFCVVFSVVNSLNILHS